MSDFLNHISAADMAALGGYILAWLGIGLAVEHAPARWPSVSRLMQHYRREWMQQMVTRTPRIFDATVVDSLRQSTAFFASASMIAIGGGAALIGNAATVNALAADLPLDAASIGIEAKLLLPMFLLANAVLKFIWSNRLFGYCAILMAAVPNDPEDPRAYPRAAQAAEVNITAAKSYNRGLRAIYFAIAGFAWIMGPLALALATLLTVAVMVRREFWSQSREVMLHREL